MTEGAPLAVVPREKNYGPIKNGQVFEGTCDCGGWVIATVILARRDRVLMFRQHDEENGTMTMVSEEHFREFFDRRVLVCEEMQKDFPDMRET